MAYKTDGTANFNFFINRQGPRGPQGLEGEQGFSPSITEGENTADTYTLQVNNKDGSFTTPNLKPQFQDRGGDVVKVDREYDTLYFGNVEAVDLTTDQTINGNKTFLGDSTFSGETKFNKHTWTLNQEAEMLTVNNSATLKNAYVTGTLSSVGEISAVFINAAGIKNNQNNKYYLNQASIAAGNNINIEETTEGVKISSTGAPDNMVTTDTAQTISGAKTFTSNITTRDDITLSRENVGIVGSFGHRVLFTTTREFYIGSSYNKTIIRGSSIVNGSNKYFLTQEDITAGSDNLVIMETSTGVQIICNAPTNAQFGQLQEFIADLSTKINNLTDRVRALEEQIDGGVAGSIYPPDPQKVDAKIQSQNALAGEERASSEEINVEN